MGLPTILLGQLLLGDGNHGKTDRHLACALSIQTGPKGISVTDRSGRQAGLLVRAHRVLRQMKEASLAKHHGVPSISSPSWVFFVLLAFFFPLETVLSWILSSWASLLSKASQIKKRFSAGNWEAPKP